MVQPPGIEPGSTVLQTAAMTTSAKVALILYSGINYINTDTFRIVSITGTIPPNSYKSLACSKLVKCPCEDSSPVASPS